MIDKGMDNAIQTLKGLIKIADKRIEKSNLVKKLALAPDNNANTLRNWLLI